MAGIQRLALQWSGRNSRQLSNTSHMIQTQYTQQTWQTILVWTVDRQKTIPLWPLLFLRIFSWNSWHLLLDVSSLCKKTCPSDTLACRRGAFRSPIFFYTFIKFAFLSSYTDEPEIWYGKHTKVRHYVKLSLGQLSLKTSQIVCISHNISHSHITYEVHKEVLLSLKTCPVQIPIQHSNWKVDESFCVKTARLVQYFNKMRTCNLETKSNLTYAMQA